MPCKQLSGLRRLTGASLLTDRIATKDDLKALENRLNARIAYAQVAAVLALSAVIVVVAFLGG